MVKEVGRRALHKPATRMVRISEEAAAVLEKMAIKNFRSLGQEMSFQLLRIYKDEQK